MIKKNTEPAKLVIYNRDGLIEKEHFGYVVRCDRNRVIEKILLLHAICQNYFKIT